MAGGSWDWTQAWLTEALLLTMTLVTSWRWNWVRVRTVRLTVLSVTHLRSKCPLRSSDVVKGCPLVAAWDLQVTSLPAKFLFSSSRGVGVQPYPRPPGVAEKPAERPQPVFLFPAIAKECLARPCSPWGGCLGHVCWDATKMSPPFPTLCPPCPASALEFGPFAHLSGEH